MAKKSKRINCRPSFRISEAGHLLATNGSSKAGKVLSQEGKKAKAKRRSKGCLNGTDGTFRLTDKQKKKLPLKLQKAILAYQRKKGKRIID
ncbi:MAG: hypothetical protein H0U95_15370 [Bacteroidetes bacterium]|nr:hypothetical protein [Bacteroidota bacterium]